MNLIQRLLKKWFQGIIELILFFPLLLIIYVNTSFSLSIHLWMGALALIYLMGVLCAQLLGVRSRWVFILLGTIAVGMYVDVIMGRGIHGIMIWFLGILMFYRGYLFWIRNWTDVMPIYVFWLCTGVYFFSSFIFSRIEIFDPYFPLVTAAGLITLILTLWTTNFANLKNVNLAGKKATDVSTAIMRHNRLSVVIIVILILFISFFNILKNMIASFFSYILGVIHDFINRETEDLPPSIEPEQDIATPDFGLQPEQSEPSIWLLIFNTLAAILGIAIGLLLLYFAIRALIKLVYTLYVKIVAFLKTKGFMTSDDAAGYVDEKKKIVSVKELGSLYKNKFQQWLSDKLKREPKWQDLRNNKERIRYVYRHWLLQRIAAGYVFKSSLTPRETSEELKNWKGSNEDNSDLAAMYNEARYSNKEIADDKIVGIQNQFKKD